MKLSDIDLKDLLSALKSFSYDIESDGERVPVNVVLYPDSLNDTMYRFFNQFYGNKVADDIAIDLKEGAVSVELVANVIKTICSEKWKHYLGMWQAEYNPIWNVDGTEVRTIETKYGKITTMTKGSTITNTQLTDSESVTEQITAGTATDYVSPEDSQSFNPQGKTETDSGKVKGTSRNGTTTSTGSGSDSDTLSGTDTVTDTFVRGGNIGVTMTQQLLSAEKDFWTKMDFFGMWFNDIVEQISIPMWEV